MFDFSGSFQDAAWAFLNRTALSDVPTYWLCILFSLFLLALIRSTYHQVRANYWRDKYRSKHCDQCVVLTRDLDRYKTQVASFKEDPMITLLKLYDKGARHLVDGMTNNANAAEVIKVYSEGFQEAVERFQNNPNGAAKPLSMPNTDQQETIRDLLRQVRHQADTLPQGKLPATPNPKV